MIPFLICTILWSSMHVYVFCFRLNVLFNHWCCTRCKWICRYISSCTIICTRIYIDLCCLLCWLILIRIEKKTFNLKMKRSVDVGTGAFKMCKMKMNRKIRLTNDVSSWYPVLLGLHTVCSWTGGSAHDCGSPDAKTP